MKLLMIMITAIATITSTAFAGETANLKSLGFSKNGRYYAFAQYGVQDGSGFPYASVSVVEIAKNTLIATKSVILQNESENEATALKQTLAAVNLGQYGIVAGKNMGQTLLSRAITDRSTYHDSLFSLNPDNFNIYELIVETKKMEDTTEGKWCTGLSENGPQGLKLSLVSKNRDANISYLLQDDQKLPATRVCPLGYSVQQVIRNGTGLVVLVNYSTVGFEGPDHRFIAVTGTPAL